MQGVDGVRDALAGGDKDRGGAGGAAAAGEAGGAFGVAGVCGDDGVEAEGWEGGWLLVGVGFLVADKGGLTFVEDVFDVFHVSEGLVVGLLAGEFVDFGFEFGPDVASSGEDVERVAEETRGGVPAREEDVQELVPQLSWVVCDLGELVQEDVASRRLFLGACARATGQGVVHEFVGELVHGLARLVEFAVRGERQESSGASAVEQLALRVVECAGEELLLRPWGCEH